MIPPLDGKHLLSRLFKIPAELYAYDVNIALKVSETVS